MFHTLSLSTLQTLRDKLVDSLAAGALDRSINALGYKVGTRELQRASLKDIGWLMHQVEKAIDAKSGNDIGYTSFGPGIDPDPFFTR